MHRRVINRMRKSRIKTAEKHLTEQIETDNSEGAKAALSKCFSEYDQAAKKGTVHKSKANRRKQRLAISVAKMG